MGGRGILAGLALLCGCTGRLVEPPQDESTSATDDTSRGDPSTTSTASTTADGTAGPTDADDTLDDDGVPQPDVVVYDCGDGVLVPGEECDDGNDVPADGCNPGCVPGGAVYWEQVLPETDISDQYVHERLAVSADDTIAVVGVQRLRDREIGLLWKFAPDGNAVSNAPIAEEATDDVRPVGVAFVGAEIVVVGEAAIDGPRFVHRWRYDTSSLALVQDDALLPVGNNDLGGVAIAPDGTLAFANNQSSSAELFAYGPESPLWAASLPDARISALAYDPLALELVGSGELGAAPGSDTLVRWDAMGGVSWSTADAIGIDTLTVVPMHTVLLAGNYVVPGARRDVAAVDPGGAQLWLRTSSELGPPDGDHASPALRAVTVDPAGHIVLVGWADQTAMNSTSSWVAKLDPDGALRWQKNIVVPAQEGLHDYAMLVATLSDATIVVAGRLDTTQTWLRALAP